MILKKKFIITAIVIFSACLLFSGAYVNYTTHSGNLTTDPTISFSNDTPINPNIKPLNLKSQNFQDDWRSQYQGIDQDGNGISDELDAKFKDLEISIFSNQKIGKTPNKKESFLAYQYDNDLNIEEELIRIIVKTSEENLDQVLQIFKEHGGHMKTNFSPFLDAFGGSININRLEPFRETLNQLGFPFFIEEDGKVQAQLYYTGRNMNLRPYVWNTLGYDGDETSAIAIIDTGLDESHPMHSSFINGNYGAKVVGWRDETDNDIQSAPYDDNGHGSHCAGIAAGDGTPTVDGLGRVVVSNTAYEDYTGWYALPQLVSFNFTIFNVTSAGALDVYCSFEDITIPPDYVFGSMYLYHEGSLKASYENNITAWTHTLSYEVPEDELGIYYVQVDLYLVDGDFDGYVYDFGFALRVEPHWFFDEDLMDAGNAWRGIASDTHLVGVKVLDAYGGGWDTDVADGINWVVANKEALNITTISMSLGGAPNSLLIDAVNNAIDAGIVVVAAAGNYGPGGNYIGSPGDADNSICVAAMNYRDEITSYSSQGGYSYTGATIKPDITAPGGSSLALQVFSTDANDNDASGYYTDGYPNDLRGAQGTSMACPAVAGAANLLIEAMGGRPSWSYTADQVKLVKALLLMTATETFPLLREQGSNTTSPVLNRGGKDIHEGYGRINVDIAIEAYTGDLAYGNIISDTISSSVVDPFAKHGFGCHVDLVSGQVYNFNLDVPLGADFDLYLYNDDPTSIGEPILEASSISSVDGEDELLTFVPTETGRYYLVVKAISGSGLANLSIFEIEHDLSVSLGGVPSSYRIGETYSLSAMVTNIGSHDENNVNIGIYIDGVAMNYEVISILPSGNDYTIYYDWTPTVEQFYNISAYALPIPDEYTLQNNLVYEVISIYTFPIPVHRYRFEELAGTVVYDTGNTPVHGTRFNTLIDQPGIDGRSYFFNVSDTISFPPDSSFSFTDQITLSAWIKPVERGAITNSSLYVILGKGFSLT
ncbi:MAG: S8 family serine peptidase, partial [Promethearchaeota archaeon]